MGQTTKKVRVENIYEQSPQFEANVKAFMTSANLQEAMPQVKHVRMNLRYYRVSGYMLR